jgi:MFS family permease
VVSAAAFIAAMASSIFFPAVPQVQADLHASSSQIALTASMFILFQGIFPTFWAATSEIVGRKPCYLVSSCVCSSL